MSAIVLPHPNCAATEMRKMVEARIARERRQLERLGIANPQFKSSEIIQALRDNEVGDARLVVRLLRRRFCYDHAQGRWYR